MPALRMLGRRWSVATDDVPMLAVVPTLCHGIWACGLGIGWCVLGRPDGCHEGAGYSVVVAGLFFCFTANFVLGSWLCYEGLKGAPAARARPTSYCVVGRKQPLRPAAGSHRRLCAPRLPLRHAPAVARALHPVLAAHGAGRGNMHQLCALPLMPWPRLLRATFCGPTPTARPRSTACSAALWHRQPSSLLSCVPHVGGRLWLSLNSQAPAVLPHRPHHPLGAARRGPGAAVLAAHLVRALL